MKPPKIPEKVRTWSYVVGVVAGIGVGPSLAAFALTEFAVATSALAGAASALAFGYRPTKPPEGWTRVADE